MQTNAASWKSLQLVYAHKRMTTAIEALQSEMTA
jgi:hypothetical protein